MSDAADLLTADDSPAGAFALDLASVEVSAKTFLGLAQPSCLTDTLRLRLTDQCYLPKGQAPMQDWVARVACPAFLAYRHAHPEAAAVLKRFCTIGTGAGLDALAAAEVLKPAVIAITDLHRAVVDQAMANILANLKRPDSVILRSGVGDLLTPFDGSGLRFDLIYENLPNIPLPADVSLDDGQASSSFIAPRGEAIPPLARDYLLDLHIAFLLQARRCLSPGGAVLCSIGGRLPLRAMLRSFAAVDYRAEILLYSWKIQSEAEEVIGGYAEAQTRGHGPFHFYLAEDLDAAFAGAAPIRSTREALALESALASKRIDPASALKLHRAGRTIGHTAAVIEGRPAAVG
ncbi:hypothetical protein [Pelagibius sp.]|uniref:hypothetical protein n=1 Tax=Pelagibius sp. TaxID=1931238 RepID=UPI003B50E94A